MNKRGRVSLEEIDQELNVSREIVEHMIWMLIKAGYIAEVRLLSQECGSYPLLLSN
ncbi:hypothetical protein DRN86_02265 [Candidatus Geothermarchaeota archaeon]|nr:MAG: hypothetical protein DRN86_02265 [Candidatus Geothermarchaeota archaeon]